MDPQKLEYFLAVRDHGSINAAAGALGVAQPTISQALRSLERELGVELFHRIGRGVVPTSAGHALAAPARRLLRAISSAAPAAGAGRRVDGTVEIAAAPSPASGPFIELLAAFSAGGDVTVRLARMRDERTGLDQLREGDVEILLTHLPLEAATDLRFADHRLASVPLGTQEYWYAAPPGSALPPGEVLPITDVPDIPMLIVPQAVVADDVGRALADAGRLPRPSAVLEHREARLDFVAAGLGACFIESTLIEEARARGVQCLPVDPPVRRDYGLVYVDGGLSPAARAFVDFAAQWPRDS
ncbi:MAG: LysR family transcriptional regulator [Mobilicoccus sp.]|nr:LysR family transcriptional regulator [Mobilicoccus sp.]